MQFFWKNFSGKHSKQIQWRQWPFSWAFQRCQLPFFPVNNVFLERGRLGEKKRLPMTVLIS